MLHDEKCPECNTRTLIYDFKRRELFCSKCGLVIADNLRDIFHDDEAIIECEECGSRNIICDCDNEELFCGECGAVIEEGLSDRWHIGAPMTYRIHDKGLSTLPPRGLYTWGWVPSMQKRTKRRLLKRIWVTSFVTTERSLIYALSEIDWMACALVLPNDIKEAASVFFRKAAKQNLIKGRSIEELVSAMLYIICRQYGVPRTLKEIAKVSRSPLKKIRRAYIFLLGKLGLEVAPAEPSHYIHRFCSKLGLSGVVREKAIEIIKEKRETGEDRGWAPIGKAAAAIYIATRLCGGYRSMKEIAKVAGTTEITIQNRYEELSKVLDIDELR